MLPDLTREAQAGGDTRHGGRDEMVEVTVGWCCQLEGTEADVVQSLIVNAIGFISVLNELMNGQRCIVRLNDCVGHLHNFHLISN